MYRVVLADSFIEEGSIMHSDQVYQQLHKNLRNLEASDYGFRRAPASLVEEYGRHLRTLIVSSFYYFYRINESDNLIEVLHLSYARRNLGTWVETE